MVWFKDELIGENCVFLSATTLRLTGALADHRRFRDAKRRDGNAVQSGDTTAVGVVQTPAGRAIVRATLTLGAEDTMALDGTKIWQSTAGAGLPGFSSAGQPGRVYIAATADDAAFDDQGNLTNPDKFRKSLFKGTITGAGGFVSENGTLDNEAVVALGLAAEGDGLGGPVWFDADDSASVVDGEDVFANAFSSAGRVKRFGIKPWPTKRGDTLASGNLLGMLNASTATRTWLLVAWDSARAHRSAAIVHGHASAPQVDVLSEWGALPFELSGTTVGVRNNSGGALTVAHIKPVIG